MVSSHRECGCEVRQLGEESMEVGVPSMEKDFVWDLEVWHLFRTSEEGSKGTE